ncbi:TerD family protein [Brevibacillus sp. SYSU BS000544]|uniref:TerD family protein n=1 Tax=Brevibacillus sp. SYSU BS000544 TaxID=3416443 RepID=UPI003CE457E8
MQLQKGQKVAVTNNGSAKLKVCLGWSSLPAGADIDGAAFLLDETGKCRNDEDFIFYGNPTSVGSAIMHAKGTETGNQEVLSLDTSKLPSYVKRIAFSLTIHEGEKFDHVFGGVKDPIVQISNLDTNQVILTFPMGEGLTKETAIVAGELYVHNGEWKFNAIGSGFHGGLAALCKNFGIEVIEAEEAPPLPKPEPAPVPKQPPVNLSKVELKKRETVSIKKSERVTAKLEWESKKDLDLYCFYVTKDGKEGKVYYKNLGKPNVSPFITLDGDSKKAGCETIVIHKPDELKFVLFSAYSAVSNGIGSFKSMKARAVVDNHEGQTVIARLLEENRYAYWVAIAHIDFSDMNKMKVSHVESYSKSGSENSPKLYSDGSFKMDKGPVEFKTPSIFGSIFGGNKS